MTPSTTTARPPETLREGPVELRRRRAADLDVLHGLIEANREHLAPWLPWAGGQDREGTRDFLRRTEEAWETGESFEYAVHDLADGGRDVGQTSLMARVGPGGLEIGYWLAADATGRGLMTAAVRALLRAGFALPGVERIEIHHDVGNHASGAVPRRVGFIQDRAFRRDPVAPAETGSLLIWTMHRDTFLSGGS